MDEPQPACRLYALLARDGRSAVVLRRGPSKQVCLVRWWLGSDTFEIGQWFKGRIYERRSDLSPSGELMVYFAASHRPPYATWTAVCRPPYLTALALWPKGDCWGGGGLMASERHILLNHRASQRVLAPGFRLPRAVRVEPVAEWAGAGEDNPLYHEQQFRDGWRLVAEGVRSDYKQGGEARWIYSEPEIYVRTQPRGRGTGNLVLNRALRAIAVTEGPWYREDYSLTDASGRLLRIIPDCDWADWQSTGDLLLGKDGRLWRLPAETAALPADLPLAGATALVDLAPLRFEAKAPPKWAAQWEPG